VALVVFSQGGGLQPSDAVGWRRSALTLTLRAPPRRHGHEVSPLFEQALDDFLIHDRIFHQQNPESFRKQGNLV